MTRRHFAVRWLGALGVILVLACPSSLEAAGSRKGAHTPAVRAKTAKPAKAPKPPAAKTSRPSTPPTAKGRIQRSDAARHAFARQTGFPNGRSGYVIDHIVPLACGGADAPSNMQWQTIAAGKAKDKVERVGCR